VERRHVTAQPSVNYGRRWGKARAAYLAAHPWCVACQQAKQRTVANELDHIVPHHGNATLFWDESNWQGLCKSCHSAKTAREVGLGGTT
jgi:5-methylcytosine-specific restriction protein A